MSFVMIVEDDSCTAETVADVLQAEGHQVVRARNGQEALAALSTGDHPCVMLLDWLMPGLGGDGVLAAMQRDARLASIPVIVTSAAANIEQKVRARGKELLVKPFDLKRLLSLVCRYCRVDSCQDLEAV